MSYHRFSIIQGRAVVDPRITNAQFRTLGALGMYADKNGWCFPSQSTVGDDLGKSRQTVNEDIAALVEYGYVEKDSVTLPGNQIRMRYRLLYDPIPTGGVGVFRQEVSELPDSNDPMNDPNNYGNEKSLPPLSIENAIAIGAKITSTADEKSRQMIDSANMIAMGSGTMEKDVYMLAIAFMKTRDIVIPIENAKGNRKVAKSLVKQGVTPAMVVDATIELLTKNMTVVDLFSIQKTAVALANPAPGQGSSHTDWDKKVEME